MKKGLLYILVLICCGTLFSGCLKNGTNRTINPSMTATIGLYSFNADYVEPATITPQLNDSSTSLVIKGTEAVTGKQITMTIIKYTNTTGTYSIADKKAAATYVAAGVYDVAASGVITIKDVASNVITGYFTLTTLTGVTITNGSFVVGKPWVY